jgi:hypothetical protein
MHQNGFRSTTNQLSLSLAKRLKNGLLAISILVLVAVNIATLISDSFHTAAFAMLGTALGYTVGSKLTDKMLSRSPTISRKNDVALETEKLSRSNQTLKRQTDNLKKTIDKKSVAIKGFSKRMVARSVAATARNLSSLSGQAVPILGVAVIAGVTAWNVHDSCETVKELNALNTELALEPHLEKDNQKVCGVDIPSKEEILTEVQENWSAAYEEARIAINQAADKVPDMPEIPELSWVTKKIWTPLQEKFKSFNVEILDYWEQ